MVASQLQKQTVRIQRALTTLLIVIAAGCTTLPTPKVKKHKFPENAFIEPVTRPYETLGLVRSKVNFNTLDPVHDEDELCHNYYNKAVLDLVKMAQDKDADAVIEVRSVVFYEGSPAETFKTPECSDDGGEGQVLAQGLAVKWRSEK